MRVLVVLLAFLALANAASTARFQLKRHQQHLAMSKSSLSASVSTRVNELAATKPNWNLLSDLAGSKPKSKAYDYGKKRIGPIDVQYSESADLDLQVTRDKRREATETFFKRYVRIAKLDAANIDLWDEAMVTILDQLYAATANDPTYYVSHAADHGVRVMAIWQNYLKNLPDVVNSIRLKIFGAANSRQREAEISRSKGKLKVPVDDYADLIVDLAHILHDIGYSGLPYGIPPKFKWTHAVNGAELVVKKLDPTLGQLLPKEHFTLIVEAIRAHNWDSKGCRPPKGPCKYENPPKADGSPGKPLPRNTKDSHNPNLQLFPEGGVGAVPSGEVATKMIRGYREATLKSSDSDKDRFDPILWLLRFADNADAARARLTDGQRDAAVMECWRDLSLDCSVAKKINDLKASGKELSEEDVNGFKSNLASCKKVKSGKYFDDLIAPASVNQFSFLHYVSNYVVKRMFWVEGSVGTLMRVEFWAEPDLPSSLAVRHFPAAAAYQINRFAEAATTLFFADGKSVTEKMQIELVNFPAKGQKKTLPLAAFNRDTAKAAGLCKEFNENFVADQKCFNEGAPTSQLAAPLDKGFEKCE